MQSETVSIPLVSAVKVDPSVDGTATTSCVLRPSVSEEQCESLSEELLFLVNRHDVKVP